MLADLTRAFLHVAVTGSINGLEASPMALCPNKPLIAVVATSAPGQDIVVLDYQNDEILAKFPQERLPERILFSPSGERIFLVNGDGPCEILAGPWTNPARRCGFRGMVIRNSERS
jgi:hypothetical protein